MKDMSREKRDDLVSGEVLRLGHGAFDPCSSSLVEKSATAL
jgi:hypothetical protein